ncbi:MAG: sigma-70 family RNA polymerase sigma factor, partial [Elusimicrobia bacterium]|nr:sigma-70 family RNA polymerase sigma factor [Elusimicrobiota bacterium]
ASKAKQPQESDNSSDEIASSPEAPRNDGQKPAVRSAAKSKAKKTPAKPKAKAKTTSAKSKKTAATPAPVQPAVSAPSTQTPAPTAAPVATPSISAYSDQGPRGDQQDRHVQAQVNVSVKNGRGQLLAVFDGHGPTADASEKAAQNVQALFEESLTQAKGNVSKALTAMTAKLHELLKDEESGTTMSVLYIPEGSKKAYAAVLGDSPVVWMNEKGEAVLGPEHNAKTNEAERKAAEAKGAHFLLGAYLASSNGGGMIQLSRALGNKRLDDILNREPEIVEIPMFPGQSIVVGSDGLFSGTEKLTQAQANVLMAKVNKGASAKTLVEEALAQEEHDNTTAVIYRVPKTPKKTAKGDSGKLFSIALPVLLFLNSLALALNEPMWGLLSLTAFVGMAWLAQRGSFPSIWSWVKNLRRRREAGSPEQGRSMKPDGAVSWSKSDLMRTTKEKTHAKALIKAGDVRVIAGIAEEKFEGVFEEGFPCQGDTNTCARFAAINVAKLNGAESNVNDYFARAHDIVGRDYAGNLASANKVTEEKARAMYEESKETTPEIREENLGMFPGQVAEMAGHEVASVYSMHESPDEETRATLAHYVESELSLAGRAVYVSLFDEKIPHAVAVVQMGAGRNGHKFFRVVDSNPRDEFYRDRWITEDKLQKYIRGVMAMEPWSERDKELRQGKTAAGRAAGSGESRDGSFWAALRIERRVLAKDQIPNFDRRIFTEDGRPKGELIEKAERVIDAWKKHYPQRPILGLFIGGSRVRGHFDQNSDTDIIIVTDQNLEVKEGPGFAFLKEINPGIFSDQATTLYDPKEMVSGQRKSKFIDLFVQVGQPSPETIWPGEDYVYYDFLNREWVSYMGLMPDGAAQARARASIIARLLSKAKDLAGKLWGKIKSGFDLSDFTPSEKSFILGQAIFLFAISIYLASMPLLVYAITGSAEMTGVVRMVHYWVLGIGSLVSGRIVKKTPMKRILVGAALSRAVIFGMVGLLSLTGALPWPMLLALVALNSFVVSINHLVDLDTGGAAKIFNSDQKIEKAGYLYDFMFNTMMLIGPVLIGFPIDWLDATFGLGVGAGMGFMAFASVMLVVSSIYLRRVQVINEDASAFPKFSLKQVLSKLAPAAKQTLLKLWSTVKTVVTYTFLPRRGVKAFVNLIKKKYEPILENRTIRSRFTMSTLEEFIKDAIMSVVVPTYAIEILGLGATGNGLLISSMFLGGLLASKLLLSRAKAMQEKMGLYRLLKFLSIFASLAFVPAAVLWAVPTGGLAVGGLTIPALFFAAPAVFLMQLMHSPFKSRMRALLQVAIKNDPKAKEQSENIFGLMTAIEVGMAGLGGLLFTWMFMNSGPGTVLFEVLGVNAPLKVVTIVLALLAVVYFVALRGIKKDLEPQPVIHKSADGMEAKAMEKLQNNLKAMGLEPFRTEVVEGPADPNRPTVAILAPASVYKLAIAQEGGRQSPGDVHLVLDPSWLIQEKNLDNGRNRLFMTKGLIFDNKGRAVIVEYKTPRPVRYFANFYTMGANDRNDGVPLEENLDVPMSNSVQLEKITNEKLWTRLLLAAKGIAVPATVAFLLSGHPLLGQSAPLGDPSRGVFAAPMPKGDAAKAQIRQAIERFLENYRGEEIVIKPSGPSWHSGKGVQFFKRHQVDDMVEHVANLAGHKQMTPDGAVLVDARISPPPLYLDVDNGGDAQAYSAVKGELVPMRIMNRQEIAAGVEPHQKKDWNLRVLVARAPWGSGVTTGFFARAGTWGIPTTAEPPNGDSRDAAIIFKIEDVVKTLAKQHGLLLTQEQINEFIDEIEALGPKSLEALMENEAKRKREPGEPFQAQTDFIGLDVMVEVENGRLVAKIHEVNDHDSGGQRQLDIFYPERAGEHSREWVATMIDRARRDALRGKKIVVVGAGYKAKQFIFERARELGVKVILLDKPGSWAKKLVHQFIPLDTNQGERALKKAVKKLGRFAKNGEINGITSFWEDDIVFTAQLAEQLGLPYHSVAAAQTARNKSQTRRAMEKAGQPSPKSVAVRNQEELEEAIKTVGFPAVLKPARGAAAHATVLVESAEEARAMYETIAGQVNVEVDAIYREGTEIIMEEYLDGQEVDVDFVFQNGEPVFASVTDNWPTRKPYFVATGSSLPSRLPKDVQSRLVDSSVTGNKTLGFQDGVSHTEAKNTSQDPRIIEFNFRPGGIYVPRWVKSVWGVDLVQEQLMAAAGITGKPFKASKPLTYLEGEFIIPNENVRFDGVEGLEELKKHPGFYDLLLLKNPGDIVRIPPAGYERIGMLTAKGATAEEAQKNLARLKAILKVKQSPLSNVENRPGRGSLPSLLRRIAAFAPAFAFTMTMLMPAMAWAIPDGWEPPMRDGSSPTYGGDSFWPMVVMLSGVTLMFGIIVGVANADRIRAAGRWIKRRFWQRRHGISVVSGDKPQWMPEEKSRAKLTAHLGGKHLIALIIGASILGMASPAFAATGAVAAASDPFSLLAGVVGAAGVLGIVIKQKDGSPTPQRIEVFKNHVDGIKKHNFYDYSGELSAINHIHETITTWPDHASFAWIISDLKFREKLDYIANAYSGELKESAAHLYMLLENVLPYAELKKKAEEEATLAESVKRRSQWFDLLRQKEANILDAKSTGELEAALKAFDDFLRLGKYAEELVQNNVSLDVNQKIRKIASEGPRRAKKSAAKILPSLPPMFDTPEALAALTQGENTSSDLRRIVFHRTDDSNALVPAGETGLTAVEPETEEQKIDRLAIEFMKKGPVAGSFVMTDERSMEIKSGTLYTETFGLAPSLGASTFVLLAVLMSVLGLGGFAALSIPMGIGVGIWAHRKKIAMQVNQRELEQLYLAAGQNQSIYTTVLYEILKRHFAHDSMAPQLARYAQRLLETWDSKSAAPLEATAHAVKAVVNGKFHLLEPRQIMAIERAASQATRRQLASGNAPQDHLLEAAYQEIDEFLSGDELRRRIAELPAENQEQLRVRISAATDGQLSLFETTAAVEESEEAELAEFQAVQKKSTRLNSFVLPALLFPFDPTLAMMAMAVGIVGMTIIENRTEETDEDLVNAYRQGNRKAGEKLAKRYRVKAIGLAKTMGADTAKAEDWAQEATAHLMTKAIYSFQAGSKFSTFAYRVMKNRMLEEIRKQKNRPGWHNSVSLDDNEQDQFNSKDEITPDANRLDDLLADREIFSKAWALLSEKDQAVLRMTVFETKGTIKETAESRGVNRMTLGVRKHYAVKNLKEAVDRVKNQKPGSRTNKLYSVVLPLLIGLSIIGFASPAWASVGIVDGGNSLTAFLGITAIILGAVFSVEQIQKFLSFLRGGSSLDKEMAFVHDRQQAQIIWIDFPESSGKAVTVVSHDLDKNQILVNVRFQNARPQFIQPFLAKQENFFVWKERGLAEPIEPYGSQPFVEPYIEAHLTQLAAYLRYKNQGAYKINKMTPEEKQLMEMNEDLLKKVVDEDGFISLELLGNHLREKLGAGKVSATDLAASEKAKLDILNSRYEEEMEQWALLEERIEKAQGPEKDDLRQQINAKTVLIEQTIEGQMKSSQQALAMAEQVEQRFNSVTAKQLAHAQELLDASNEGGSAAQKVDLYFRNSIVQKQHNELAAMPTVSDRLARQIRLIRSDPSGTGISLKGLKGVREVRISKGGVGGRLAYSYDGKRVVIHFIGKHDDFDKWRHDNDHNDAITQGIDENALVPLEKKSQGGKTYSLALPVFLLAIGLPILALLSLLVFAYWENLVHAFFGLRRLATRYSRQAKADDETSYLRVLIKADEMPLLLNIPSDLIETIKKAAGAKKIRGTPENPLVLIGLELIEAKKTVILKNIRKHPVLDNISVGRLRAQFLRQLFPGYTVIAPEVVEPKAASIFLSNFENVEIISVEGKNSSQIQNKIKRGELSLRQIIEETKRQNALGKPGFAYGILRMSLRGRIPGGPNRTDSGNGGSNSGDSENSAGSPSANWPDSLLSPHSHFAQFNSAVNSDVELEPLGEVEGEALFGPGINRLGKRVIDVVGFESFEGGRRGPAPINESMRGKLRMIQGGKTLLALIIAVGILGFSSPAFAATGGLIATGGLPAELGGLMTAAIAMAAVIGLRKKKLTGGDEIPGHLQSWGVFFKLNHKIWGKAEIVEFKTDGSALWTSEAHDLAPLKNQLRLLFGDQFAQPQDRRQVLLPPPYVLRDAAWQSKGWNFVFPQVPYQEWELSDRKIIGNFSKKIYSVFELHDLAVHLPKLLELKSKELAAIAQTALELEKVIPAKKFDVLGSAALFFDEYAAANRHYPEPPTIWFARRMATLLTGVYGQKNQELLDIAAKLSKRRGFGSALAQELTGSNREGPQAKRGKVYAFALPALIAALGEPGWALVSMAIFALGMVVLNNLGSKSGDPRAPPDGWKHWARLNKDNVKVKIRKKDGWAQIEILPGRESEKFLTGQKKWLEDLDLPQPENPRLFLVPPPAEFNAVLEKAGYGKVAFPNKDTEDSYLPVAKHLELILDGYHTIQDFNDFLVHPEYFTKENIEAARPWAQLGMDIIKAARATQIPGKSAVVADRITYMLDLFFAGGSILGEFAFPLNIVSTWPKSVQVRFAKFIDEKAPEELRQILNSQNYRERYASLLALAPGIEAMGYDPETAFEGPDPSLEPADPKVFQEAVRLAQRGEALTREQAEAIIRQSIYETRMIAAETGLIDSFDSCHMIGRCSRFQADIFRRIEHYGGKSLNVYKGSAGLLLGHESQAQHVFTVVHVPSLGIAYLVDATARQFFTPGAPEFGLGPNEVGKAMRQSPDGDHIADTLIRNGYIELTAEAAEAYARGMGKNLGSVSISPEDYVRRSTGDPHWRRKELNKMFGPLPSIKKIIKGKTTIESSGGKLFSIALPAFFMTLGEPVWGFVSLGVIVLGVMMTQSFERKRIHRFTRAVEVIKDSARLAIEGKEHLVENSLRDFYGYIPEYPREAKKVLEALIFEESVRAAKTGDLPAKYWLAAYINVVIRMHIPQERQSAKIEILNRIYNRLKAHGIGSAQEFIAGLEALLENSGRSEKSIESVLPASEQRQSDIGFISRESAETKEPGPASVSSAEAKFRNVDYNSSSSGRLLSLALPAVLFAGGEQTMGLLAMGLFLAGMVLTGKKGKKSGSEPMAPQKGDSVVDQDGRVGVVEGVETISYGEVVRVKLADHQRMVPLARFHEVFTPVAESAASPDEIKTAAQKKRREAIAQRLREHIAFFNNRIYDDITGHPAADSKIAAQLKEMMREAKERGYLFRGEGRHPYAKSAYDESEGTKEGIFQKGLKSHGRYYSGGLYLTANPQTALQYPEAKTMPADWDGEQYIYLIDPGFIYDDPDAVGFELNDELIEAGDVERVSIIGIKKAPQESVVYAIKIDGQTQKITQVFKNNEKSSRALPRKKNFGKSDSNKLLSFSLPVLFFVMGLPALGILALILFAYGTRIKAFVLSRFRSKKSDIGFITQASAQKQESEPASVSSAEAKFVEESPAAVVVNEFIDEPAVESRPDYSFRVKNYSQSELGALRERMKSHIEIMREQPWWAEETQGYVFRGTDYLGVSGDLKAGYLTDSGYYDGLFAAQKIDSAIRYMGQKAPPIILLMPERYFEADPRSVDGNVRRAKRTAPIQLVKAIVPGYERPISYEGLRNKSVMEQVLQSFESWSGTKKMKFYLPFPTRLRSAVRRGRELLAVRREQENAGDNWELTPEAEQDIAYRQGVLETWLRPHHVLAAAAMRLAQNNVKAVGAINEAANKVNEISDRAQAAASALMLRTLKVASRMVNPKSLMGGLLALGVTIADRSREVNALQGLTPIYAHAGLQRAKDCSIHSLLNFFNTLALQQGKKPDLKLEEILHVYKRFFPDTNVEAEGMEAAHFATLSRMIGRRRGVRTHVVGNRRAISWHREHKVPVVLDLKMGDGWHPVVLIAFKKHPNTGKEYAVTLDSNSRIPVYIPENYLEKMTQVDGARAVIPVLEGQKQGRLPILPPDIAGF